jgi:hypothetical protein
MLSCKQVSELVSQSLDRPLTRRQRIAVRLHLLVCIACARFKRQIVLIQAMIDQFVSETEQNEALTLSLSAKERMTSVIKSKVVESGHG